MKMKRLLIWPACIIATIAILDIAFGLVFSRYIGSRTLPGDYEMTDHVLRGFDDDIAILGSSVALNSINARSVEDSLGMKTFNGGANGQQFPFYLTSLKAIVGRKAPRKVILGLIPSNLADSGIGTRYNFLAPYYGLGIADIDSILSGSHPADKIFMRSNFYRLNRIWFRIGLYHFASAGIRGENGFIAKPVPSIFPERQTGREERLMSAERRGELEEFARICRDNGIDLTVVITPRCLDEPPQPAVGEAREICRRYGAGFFDDSALEPFRSDSTLFYDMGHININGSKIYTDTIINRIRQQQ